MLLTSVWATEQRWIPDGADVLRVSGGLTSPGLDVSVTGPGADLTYIPNSPPLIFLAASYGEIGLSLQLPAAADGASVREKGKTSVQDYQLRFFGHRNTHEIIYQRFKGYSIQDWKHTDGGPILRPEMKVHTAAYNYITAVSPAFFSNAVAFAQKGVQTAGGGSMLIWGSLGHTTIASDQPMAPEFIVNERSRIHGLREVRVHYLMGGVGYGYMVPVFTRVYGVISIYGGLGSGYQKSMVEDPRPDWSFSGLYRIGLRAGAGYNFGDHALSAQLIVDQNMLRVADGQVGQATLETRLAYTYRFQGVHFSFLNP